MKIKIDKNGFLFIERAGKFKAQFCKNGIINAINPLGKVFYSATNNSTQPSDSTLVLSFDFKQCGDWCPSFIEPNKTEDDCIIVNICNILYILKPEELIDERLEG